MAVEVTYHKGFTLSEKLKDGWLCFIPCCCMEARTLEVMFGTSGKPQHVSCYFMFSERSSISSLLSKNL